MHSALKEATSGEVDRVTCLRDRDGRTRVRRQESGRAQGGGDIHIEYKNNRHLNTNNCKVLQVLTSLKKKRESKEKKERKVLGRTPGLRALRVQGLPGAARVGQPRDSEREDAGPGLCLEAPFRTFSTQSGAPARAATAGRDGAESPQPSTSRFNGPLAWGSLGTARVLRPFVTNAISKNNRYVDTHRSVAWIP